MIVPSYTEHLRSMVSTCFPNVIDFHYKHTLFYSHFLKLLQSVFEYRFKLIWPESEVQRKLKLISIKHCLGNPKIHKENCLGDFHKENLSRICKEYL